jgi:DNA-binding CsgD family transcriptional regulator
MPPFPDAGPLCLQLNLTPRQAQVLHWIAEGKTNSEIGTIMDCSFHTVKNHLKEIFKRLEVSSRTAAASCAYRALMAESEALLKEGRPPQ